MRIVAAVVAIVSLTFPGLALADPSTLTIGSATATVTGPSSTVLNFPITRTGDTTFDAFTQYQTMDGTAVAGKNYTAAAGSLLMPAGTSIANIPVTITGSTFNQPDLAFQLLLPGGGGGGFTPTFAAQQTFGTGNGPQSVAMADVNGDGKIDLIVVNQNDNTVSVLLNTTAPGATTPSFAAQQTFATGKGPSSIATKDLNGDGIPDLVIANADSNTVSVLLNTTAPGATTATFNAQQTFATGNQPSSVAIADLNGDGVPDLVVTNLLGNTVSVLLNTTAPGSSSASFTAQQTFAVGTAPRSVAARDVNGDGLPDLVVANSNSNTVSVLLNTTAAGATTPSFTAQQTFATGNGPSSVAVADVNGDGMPDLMVANEFDADVSVLLNTTAPGASVPSFASQHTFATGTGPVSLAAPDVNGDGKPDLVVANGGQNTASVLLNVTAPGAATPSFAAQVTFAVGSAPVGIAAGDVNGDGRPDLIVTNQSDNTTSVLLNTTAQPSTSFGPNSFASQNSFATVDGPEAITAADINGDGKPDLILGTGISPGAHNSRSSAFVLLNTTPTGANSPNFLPQQRIQFCSGICGELMSVTAADMNGDGKPDIIIADANETQAVMVNTTPPGSSTASFVTQFFSAPHQIGQVLTADVNGDGKPDLIVGNLFADVSVLLNTTAPGSNTITMLGPQSVSVVGTSVAMADVNGDGKVDMIGVDQNAQTVSVALNTTTPGANTISFTAGQAFAVGNRPEWVTAADVNGDGKPDLIVANENDNTVSVLLNTTAPGAAVPSFASQQAFMAGAQPLSVAVADVNGDGKPDLIVGSFGSSNLAVLINTTSPGASIPSFAAQQTFASGAFAPAWVTTADFNGDGEPDIAAANHAGSGTVSVLFDALYSTTTAGSPATGTIHYNVTNPSPTATSTPTATATPTPTPTPTATPTVSASLGFAPARVNFGKVGLNQIKFRTVKLTNEAPKKGGATIAFGTPSISGSTAFAQFNNCVSLAPKRTCTVRVRFLPKGSGPTSAVLTINDNGSNAPQLISLTGTGK